MKCVTEIDYTGTAEDEMNINWNIASLRDIYIYGERENFALLSDQIWDIAYMLTYL